MDSKTHAHIVGESIAKLYFELRGFYTYTNSSGKAEFDFVISKDGFLYSVEVKTVSSLKENSKGTYFEVQLKSVRSNTTANTIKTFDKSKSDYLVVVNIKQNSVKVFETSEVAHTCSMRIYSNEFTTLEQLAELD